MATAETDIVSGLAEIVEEVTGVKKDEVTPDKNFVDDLDVDSLSMVEIAVQTEDKYGIEIPDERMRGMRTVRDVVDYIKRVTIGRSQLHAQQLPRAILQPRAT